MSPLFFVCVYMASGLTWGFLEMRWVCECLHVSVGAYIGTPGVLSHQTWELGTQLVFSVRAAGVLKHRVTFPASGVWLAGHCTCALPCDLRPLSCCGGCRKIVITQSWVGSYLLPHILHTGIVLTPENTYNSHNSKEGWFDHRTQGISYLLG